MAIQAPKGTKDVLPGEAYKWQYLENKFRKIAASYGHREIRTPVFEYTELFQRGVGETTDVVQKEMYTFEDKAGRSITLKPEGTSPAVRAFVQGNLYNEVQPTKLFYFTPALRYENVQKGRLREHHQFGVEAFGASGPSIDAEIISLAMRVYREFGIKDVELNINSIGCAKCRKEYNNALKEYLSDRYGELCDTCKTRFDRNPMRILDCKIDGKKDIVKNAPKILDYLCDDCREHFEGLKKYLDALGIEFKINPLIVRGLDYYTKTVFEIINNDITICAGGRYDYLIEEVGGPELPAMGFGMGIERTLLTLKENGIEIPEKPYIDLYIGAIGNDAKLVSLKLANTLREEGLRCECDHTNRSVKAEMKYANKINAKFTVILGENELDTYSAKFKRMDDGQQFELKLDDLTGICNFIG
ncbi:MAG: histidine--tRNA ligase [Clostridium tyrobutyricum]|jgi:histidyl-tRNA synthetase|uniref:histidine--tRNA ligase n=2 Tax=Clostridium tyrobutyricum TaxID=1519 RepID=UPI00242F8B98|nr:histidine--tRNA ligase [Clostridium tyrobutyricum]MCH4236831.1 histidine--tRNA ligase [Clostridium tyrobutyricum]MCH4258702.1 histidine--tRNA ligase [Clostridium tyrobutyricum]MCI1239579.1 histidine--tRNA ligase [Clostridium tyrobutyricum]MCI1652673.1 histidine--tRNA ligase [Clostridium tyrobutyricum]MCI1937770.1 histidine--tRNA ligase [Clostridium tyrobutyricum]